jgi:hypothetical protein
VGEAVRSAILSGHRCLLYDNFEGSPLEFGIVRIRGEGARRFLHGKLTKSFHPPPPPPPATASAQPPPPPPPSFTTACLLDAKGRVVDVVRVAVVTEGAAAGNAGAGAGATAASESASAFVLTGPGHSSTQLFRRLDPFVFPLDRVAIADLADARIFTLASVDRASVQNLYDRLVRPEISAARGGAVARATDAALPGPDGATLATVSRTSLLIVPCTQLPECAAVGYTFCLWDDPANDGSSDSEGEEADARALGSRLWNKLLGDPDGPVHVGPSEFESLRIEAGSPRRGAELTGGKRPADDNEDDDAGSNAAPGGVVRESATRRAPSAANPLELHLDHALDLDKGCYLGQEGVASVLKNPRGPPRLLYQVVFDDASNHYEDEETDGGAALSSEGSRTAPGDNLTRAPIPGDQLYVLGSNQEIAVGALTSVAAPGSTGEPTTVGLAVVRRADSIVRAMVSRGLELPESVARSEASSSRSSSASPSKARTLPLEGLEVIVGGTYTVGRLQTVPSLRYRPNENMFLSAPSDNESASTETSPTVLDAAEDIDDPSQDPWEPDANLAPVVGGPGGASPKDAEVARAAAEAEAQRKADKMEQLRRRAEEAMARRKNKKNVPQ